MADRPFPSTQPILSLGCCIALAFGQRCPAAGEKPAGAPKPLVIAAQRHSKDNAQAVAFSPDGRLVAAAFGGPTNGRFPLEPRGGGVAIWETATGKQLRFIGEYGDIIRLEFSGDGLSLAYARVYTPGDSIQDDVVVVLDVDSGKVRRRWRADTFATLPAPDRLVIPSGQEGCLALQLDDFQIKGRLLSKYRQPRCLAVSSDGKLVAAVHHVEKPVLRKDGTVDPNVFVLRVKGLTLFNATTLDEMRQTQSEKLSSCYALAVAPGGKQVATGHNGGMVRIWDGATLKESRQLTVDTANHVCPLFAPDGQKLAVLTQAASGSRYANDEKGIVIDRRHAGPGCELCIYDTKTFAMTHRWQFEDGAFRTWYARFGKSMLHPEYNPGRLAFSPDGKHLLVGCNGAVLVEAATGKVVRQFDPQ